MQAVEGERAAAKEAAQLLLKAGDENLDEEAAKDQEAKHVEESRMVMQAMHVPHELGRFQPVHVIQRACVISCISHSNKRCESLSLQGRHVRRPPLACHACLQKVKYLCQLCRTVCCFCKVCPTQSERRSHGLCVDTRVETGNVALSVQQGVTLC